MDLTDITDIKKTLKAFGVHSRKELGQHFLIDSTALSNIIEAADIRNDDTILEIGPGMGILTRELCRRAKRVVAVELDEAMVGIVKTTCIRYSNLEVKNQDIMKYNPSDLGRYKLVANLPYYITSMVIRRFLETENKPEEMVILVQKEVAERICAKPSRMSILAVSVQFYGEPTIIAKVPHSSFFPTPGVDSAILKIRLYTKPLFPSVEPDIFFRIVKAGFSEKRKQLINSISGGLNISRDFTEKLLSEAGIDMMARAESLSMIDWHNLYKVYMRNKV